MRVEFPDGREAEINFWKYIWIPIVLLIGLVLATSFHQVDADEEGVLLRFGKQVKTVGPGLQFHLPYPIDKMVKVKTRRVDVQEFGYRSGPGGRITESGYDDESSMLTGDLNIVLAGWDVQFSRENPEQFLFNVKDPIATLRDISQSVMREIMGDRASIPILTIGRAEIQERVRKLIQAQADQFKMGLRINEVNLIFVSPPAQVQAAFNDLNKAEQDAVRFYEEASREYQENVPRAQGQAERIVLESEGFLESRVNRAEGDADRFLEMLRAYEESPEVTRQRLYLETLEKRLPEVGEVWIVDEDMKGVLPLLNLNEGGLKQ
ncbi:FtsH protease activity modulator HflK [Puniceicoccus vermicola]|uniref:Protein HflK n=1 Tax=Puniceicoccus vermicola TaxID=388746 RepID=A0A7X1B0K4_9BACT|nr:FtsH protease activity modulator HflK [Puniceicoccus vermicola]